MPVTKKIIAVATKDISNIKEGEEFMFSEHMTKSKHGGFCVKYKTVVRGVTTSMSYSVFNTCFKESVKKPASA